MIEDVEGIENLIRGRNAKNIRYTDDILSADSEEKEQPLVNRVQQSCGRKGLKINANKTKSLWQLQRSRVSEDMDWGMVY